MLTLTILTLALSASSNALPALSKKSCTAPSTFTIEQFSTFHPSAGNSHAPNLFFKFGDDNFNTQCNSNSTSESTSPIPCTNSSIKYEWDGANTLTVGESYIPCDSTSSALAVGSIYISLDCIPSEAPFGPGTQCEDPVGELTGEFTRNTWSA